MSRSGLLGATAVLALMAGTAWAGPVDEDGAEPLIVEIPADEPETLPAVVQPAATERQQVPQAAFAEQAVPVSAPATVEEPAPQQQPVQAAVEPPAPPQPVRPAVSQPQPAPQQAVAETSQQNTASADIPAAIDIPGVLTRKGALVIEPGIEYSHSSQNQFAFGGVQILNTFLVGAIEAKQANRDAITGTLGLRLGLTDRLEAEARIPYMYRNDSSTNTLIDAGGANETVSLSDHGLGDVEGALHYQFNDGTGKWPVFVGNFRAKSATGTSPYDVSYDQFGVARELATGSGSWGLEPSLTVIAPSDPAVFYANIGYLWNMQADVNKQIGTRFVEKVDPGDAIRFGVGMGLALNEKVSLSIGYQHDWIMKTTTTFSDGTAKSSTLSVGSLTFGVNWQMADNAALNVSVGVGVTTDAPDVRLMARVPITLNLW
ncbi:MAG TPA: hypothetical protein VL974_16005 [Magnetospirillum sp.]|jgi:hypothetical protein|nr:hypothetical protein [Magnetospirillum sp.]